MAQQLIDKIMRRIDYSGDINEDIELQVRDLCEDTEQQLCNRLGVEAVPDKLNYIVVDVTVKKYNRIGSEGTASHSVDGESMTWAEDPFAEFAEDLDAWKNANATGRMRVRFL